MTTNVRFLSTAFFVPEKKISNIEITETIDTSDGWIQEHTGIKTRYLADSTTSASDLAYEASKRAIDQAEISINNIQMIILATSTPDYLSFPATANVLQKKLGIEHCISYDIAAACSGFTFACSSAIDAIFSDMVDTALVVGSEIFSSIIDWNDRATCILFGDGAGASILSSKFSGNSKIIARHLMSLPQEYTSLFREKGGSANRDADNASIPPPSYLSMDGRKVYIIALDMLVTNTNILLQKSNLTTDDIDYVIPHQANLKMIQKGMKKLNIPMEKVIVNIDKYANTSAASIPIALAEALEDNKIQRGMKLLLLGFGAGFMCGGILLEW